LFLLTLPAVVQAQLTCTTDNGPGDPGAKVVFSPDGRFLATSISSEYCFWEVGWWSLVRRIP
jgi:hypothetical protein